MDVGKAVQFVLSCMNFDGGFGRVPGSESHAGQVRTGFDGGFGRVPGSESHAGQVRTGFQKHSVSLN